MARIIAKYFIITGLALIVVGGLFFLSGKVEWLGRLPGDILIKREKSVFYFPITTCILASVILSIILYIFFRK
ncbi:MAG: DUF2905 domain-containing protein [Candidatus Omnitrophica bacterium]|nr:DUF2905 domain-containing protein [Candidatus Omnitrophota bacterium]